MPEWRHFDQADETGCAVRAAGASVTLCTPQLHQPNRHACCPWCWCVRVLPSPSQGAKITGTDWTDVVLRKDMQVCGCKGHACATGQSLATYPAFSMGGSAGLGGGAEQTLPSA